MATKPFETYFDERTLLTGQQAPAGDHFLTLRSGTVFKQSVVYNKAYAGFNNSPTQQVSVADVWMPLDAVMVQGATTPTFTFATNQFTYIGPNQIIPNTIKAAMSCVVEVAGGGHFEIGVFVNGLLIGDPMVIAVAQGFEYVATEVTRLLVTGDIIEIKIRELAGTDTVTVSSAQLVIA